MEKPVIWWAIFTAFSKMEKPVIFVVFFFDLFQTVLYIMPSSWCEAEGRSYYSDPQNFVVLPFFLSIKGGANLSRRPQYIKNAY